MGGEIKEDSRVRHIPCLREMRNACKGLVGKPEGKRSVASLRHSQKYSVEIECKWRVWPGFYWQRIVVSREL
jgi:hypothetical protein